MWRRNIEPIDEGMLLLKCLQDESSPKVVGKKGQNHPGCPLLVGALSVIPPSPSVIIRWIKLKSVEWPLSTCTFPSKEDAAILKSSFENYLRLELLSSLTHRDDDLKSYSDFGFTTKWRFWKG